MPELVKSAAHKKFISAKTFTYTAKYCIIVHLKLDKARQIWHNLNMFKKNTSRVCKTCKELKGNRMFADSYALSCKYCNHQRDYRNNKHLAEIEKNRAAIDAAARREAFAQKKRNYKKYEKYAAALGVGFELSPEEIQEKLNTSCFYEGSIVSNSGTLLLKNSTTGFTLSNTINCCPKCLTLKGQLTHEQFLELCDKITKHQSLK